MRCAVVSDIHANWDALHAVLVDAGEVDQLWCLGDVIDGGPQPNECLDALRERHAICIAGNHEDWVLGKLPDRLQETPLGAWARWTYERLSTEHRSFLEALPERIVTNEFTLLHYPHGSLEPPTADDLASFSSRYCLIGHTHLPLLCSLSADREASSLLSISRPPSNEQTLLTTERAIINVGSVGRSFVYPRLASYLVIETIEQDRAITLTFRSIPYPVESLCEKLDSCGVPSKLAVERRSVFDGPDAIRERVVGLHRAWYADLEMGFSVQETE